MSLTIVELCGQGLCTTDASHSFVWPGHGRKYICEVHLETLKGVAGGLGLSLESLDIQPLGAPGVVVSADKWRIPNAGGLDDPRRLLRSFPPGTRVRAVRDIVYITEGGEVAEGELGTVGGYAQPLPVGSHCPEQFKRPRTFEAQIGKLERRDVVPSAVVSVLWDALGETRETFIDSIDRAGLRRARPTRRRQVADPSDLRPKGGRAMTSALETDLGTFGVESLDRASEAIQTTFEPQDVPAAIAVTGALWFFVKTLRASGFGVERLRRMLDQAVELARALDAERAVDLDEVDDQVERESSVSLRIVGLTDGATIRVEPGQKEEKAP